VALLGEESIWSAQGCQFIASLLAVPIQQNSQLRTARSHPAAERPATFGDQPPGTNEAMDEGTSLEYKLGVNNQGLRMNYDLHFPKNKQRILILGDEKVLNPFVDNNHTVAAYLQRTFPDKEIINAGYEHYTMDDFETLYKEKARYTEPDLVFVLTDGGDILENYFTQRNRYSRVKKIYRQTRIEEAFYYELYGTKN
jgi:hypothetical protein